MEDIGNDSRFSHITKDPRFKRIPKWEKKIKIDKRFQSMFKDKQFKLNYAVDKRGRPVIHSSSEDLKKYYALSSDDDDDDDDDSNDGDTVSTDEEVPISSQEKLDKEKKENPSGYRTSLKKSKLNKDQMDSSENESFSESYIREEKVLTESVKEKLRDLTVDYARGGGVLFSDSSSEEESSDIDSEEEELDHGWGELDRDAERTDEITNTLALCHMDWDRIRAVDLMVLFNSFLPQGGFLQSVAIYPSEFGLKRMKEEEVKGPLELLDKKNNEEDENDEEDKNENEEGSAYSMEKLRQYQLNRLKYFYAILIFDSPETANKVYLECDGMEYESSATRLDLRFVPNNTTFDQEPHEICNKLPDPSKYQPRYFTTTALQQAKVDLTWDETNPEREELNKKLTSGQVDGISEADLRDYLATSSEDESGGESGKEDKSENKNEATTDDPVLKYRSLLQEIEETEEKKKKNDVEMEITWGVGLKEKTEKLVQKKLKEKQNDLTPFEKFLEKKKEKKIQKKEEKKKKANQETGESDNVFSDDDIPSDVDMNDPYFKEEFQGDFNKKEKKIKQKKDDNNSREELQQDQAELELLLMNDAEEKNHFSLKSILEQESDGKKKLRKKKKRKQTSTEEKTEDFKVNVKDERFSALYSSHHFNIDPTDPHYRKTKGMEALRAEKISYRQQNQTNLVPTKRCKTDYLHNQDPELSVLVKTVKRKAQNLQRTGR